PRTTSKKVRSPPPSADPALAWTLVGVILSVFIGVAIGLFAFAGWNSIPVAVIATAALVLTRRLWVEPVAGLASAKRRSQTKASGTGRKSCRTRSDSLRNCRSNRLSYGGARGRKAPTPQR